MFLIILALVLAAFVGFSPPVVVLLSIGVAWMLTSVAINWNA